MCCLTYFTCTVLMVWSLQCPPLCSTLQGWTLWVGIVEVNCYAEASDELILMSIYVRSRINQSIATDCRTFRPCWPLSTAYKTYICTYVRTYVYANQDQFANCYGLSLKVRIASSQVEGGNLEKAPPFQLVSATHSEALLVTMDTGVLYQWSSDSDTARPYPLTEQLKLAHGGIQLLKSSDIRTTLVLDTGEIATFYDPLLRGTIRTCTLSCVLLTLLSLSSTILHSIPTTYPLVPTLPSYHSLPHSPPTLAMPPTAPHLSRHSTAHHSLLHFLCTLPPTTSHPPDPCRPPPLPTHLSPAAHHHSPPTLPLPPTTTPHPPDPSPPFLPYPTAHPSPSTNPDSSSPQPPQLIAELTHSAQLFPGLKPPQDRIESLAVGDFLSIATTISGKSYWW